MYLIFLLSILTLAIFAGEGNPDTTGTPDGSQPPAEGGDGDSGSIKSLDDALDGEGDDGSEEPGARSVTTEPGEKKEEPQSLILGKYKTMEDVLAAHQELERKFHETSMENANLKKPPADKQPEEEWVDLSGEQLATLEKNDPEAYQWYVKEKEDRKLNEAIDKRLKPLEDKVRPIDDLQKKEQAQQFMLQEQTLGAQTRNVFGKDFEKLDKQRQDVPFLQKLFKEIPAPLADAILFHNKQGSPEYARQLLLGQIQVYNLRQNSRKRSVSVNPDPGSGSGKGKVRDSASSLEEAGDLAFEELGMK